MTTPLDLWHITGAAIDKHNAEIDRKEAEITARAEGLVDSRYWGELMAACRSAAQKGEYKCTIIISKQDVPAEFGERGELAEYVARALVQRAKAHDFSAHVWCLAWEWQRIQYGYGYREVVVDWGDAAWKEDYRQKVASGEIVLRRITRWV